MKRIAPYVYISFSNSSLGTPTTKLRLVWHERAGLYISMINIKQSLKVGIPKRSLGTRKAFILGFNVGVVADGYDCRHVELGTNDGIARFGQVSASFNAVA